MSFLKVKGKQGESCMLREGAVPAWCGVGQGSPPSSSACLFQETCLPVHLSPSTPCLFQSHPFLKPGKLGKGKGGKKEQELHESVHITTTITLAICESKGTRVGCENSGRKEMSSEFENPSLLGRAKSFQLWQKVQQRVVFEGTEAVQSGNETSLLAEANGGHREQAYSYSSALRL